MVLLRRPGVDEAGRDGAGQKDHGEEEIEGIGYGESLEPVSETTQTGSLGG